MVKYIQSFGGGVNSVALYFTLRKYNLPLDEVVFADTGCELPETYSIVERFKYVTEKDGIKFTTVKSDKSESLYQFCWDHKIVPTIYRRDCTAKFKIIPIVNYLKQSYNKKDGFCQYIGIAKEEWHRMKDSRVKYIKLIYPLIDLNIDRNRCVQICIENGFNDVIKSGCYICPFTKKDSWIWLKEKHPDLYQKVELLDSNTQSKYKILRRKKDKEMTCDVVGNCFL